MPELSLLEHLARKPSLLIVTWGGVGWGAVLIMKLQHFGG